MYASFLIHNSFRLTYCFAKIKNKEFMDKNFNIVFTFKLINQYMKQFLHFSFISFISNFNFKIMALCFIAYRKSNIIFFQFQNWMKTVDKYQFNQEQGKFDSGIECFLAYHTVIKKYFTLKRICLAEETDQGLYNYLIKEVSILKKITHDNVYRCYKMLKTKNNLYLIYDNIEGETLERALKGKLTFQARLSIVKQITSVLVQLRKNNLAHLAINASNIIVQPQNKIKIINFGQAQEIPPNQQSINLTEPFKSTLTPYIPPEIFENKAHINSDIYSFGVIITKLFEPEFEIRHSARNKNNEEQDSNESKWITRLSQLANKMAIKIPEVRINIKEFEATLNSKLESDQTTLTNKSNKSYKSSSRSESIIGTSGQRLQMTKTTSQLSAKDEKASHSQDKSLSSNKSLSRLASQKEKSITKEKESFKQKVKQIQFIIRKIVKKRNFVVVLLKMAQACTQSIQAKTSTSIILSYLLIKKAAVAISQLAKLLKVGKNAEITIDKRIQQYFFKSNFYSTINPLINKQMVSTQQMLQKITAEVTQLDSFTSNSLLMEEVKHQKMNNCYLRKCVFEFLNSLSLDSSSQTCKNYELNDVIGIYLISLLSSYKTYEQAHEALFSENCYAFEDDPLIKSLIELKKQTIFEIMEYDIQSNQNRDNDTISMAKSARTIK